MSRELNQYFNETIAQLANDSGGVDEDGLWRTVEADFRSKVTSGHFPGLDPIAQMVGAQKTRWVGYSRSAFNNNLEELVEILMDSGEGLWGSASKHLELPVRINGVIIPAGSLTVDDLLSRLKSRQDNLSQQKSAFDKSEAATTYLVNAMANRGAEVLGDLFIDSMAVAA